VLTLFGREHIYRIHPKPIHCKRCGSNFKSISELESHELVDAASICPIASFKLKGITTDQELALKRRRKGKISDVDYWKEIYRIIFPGVDPIPSPCKLKSHGIFRISVNGLILTILLADFEPVEDIGQGDPNTTLLLLAEIHLRREIPLQVETRLNELTADSGLDHENLYQLVRGALPRIIDISIRDSQRVFRQQHGLEEGPGQPTPHDILQFPLDLTQLTQDAEDLPSGDAGEEMQGILQTVTGSTPIPVLPFSGGIGLQAPAFRHPPHREVAKRRYCPHEGGYLLGSSGSYNWQSSALAGCPQLNANPWDDGFEIFGAPSTNLPSSGEHAGRGCSCQVPFCLTCFPPSMSAN
jgi:hypothetical protein